MWKFVSKKMRPEMSRQIFADKKLSSVFDHQNMNISTDLDRSVFRTLSSIYDLFSQNIFVRDV